MLSQNGDRDCSVPVFARLAGISENELLSELPQARLGEIDHRQWIDWLKDRKLSVEVHEGCPTDVVSCAHLVSLHEPRDRADFHWIYRDEEGDVHDPSPSFAAMPADDARMRALEPYLIKALTIVVLLRTPK